ncbi:MAG TPA: YbaB/EbfC family nucleoid-associated protein [Capsulimonadaceae bacterium]|jgi:hypothetical protein
MGNPFANMPGGLNGMMKAAQQAMKQAEQAEADLANERVEASSGGGVVRAIVTGKGEMIEVKIAKEVVDPSDVQLLEDLVTTAVRDALEKANTIRTERLQKIMPGGGGMPGLF